MWQNHNQLGLYTPNYTLNLLAIWGAVFPTSLACVYDAQRGILYKDQYRGEKYPTLWVMDRGETSTTLLSRDPSTPRTLHLNSSPQEFKQWGKIQLSVLDQPCSLQIRNISSCSYLVIIVFQEQHYHVHIICQIKYYFRTTIHQKKILYSFSLSQTCQP